MAVWLVRAGKFGEREHAALDKNVVTIGWDELPSLENIQTKEELEKIYLQANPQCGEGKLRNHLAQIWGFIHLIQKDDLVILPLKSQSAIAVGKVTGDYHFTKDQGDGILHYRPVTWIRKDLPRTDFDKDLLHSLGAFLTVCQIKRNDAEERIKGILNGKKPPRSVTDKNPDSTDDNQEDFNLEQISKDNITRYIQAKFSGHKLAEMVNEILVAEGYFTKVSPPGPDGGVDILAGSGPMGFNDPKICVQVKSQTSPVDVKVLRELQGILSNFQATQGLLVSWGGFKETVIKESGQNFFKIRLWDSGNLLQAIFKNYEKFSDDLQAELPLKRIWSLVQEEE